MMVGGRTVGELEADACVVSQGSKATRRRGPHEQRSDHLREPASQPPLQDHQAGISDHAIERRLWWWSRRCRLVSAN